MIIGRPDLDVVEIVRTVAVGGTAWMYVRVTGGRRIRGGWWPAYEVIA